LKLIETSIQGLFIVELEKIEDGRGFFARSWCAREFQKHGLSTSMAQCNLVWTATKGTIRGMHYQIEPYSEVKLFRCTKGSIFHVVIDLRQDSQTYLRTFGIELNDANYRALYVPENFATGYQTIRDDTEVVYQVSQYYSPAEERGIRWNDPLFNIDWPIKEFVQISSKDCNWENFVLNK